MSEEREIVKISVRNLVEFIFREGDIVSAGSGAPNTEAMQMGNKIHKKIQRSMGPGYEPEVSLFAMQEMRSREYGSEFLLKIEGRADGIFREKESVMVLSRGLGSHTIPVRVFNPGELWVIDFRPEE